MASNPPKPPPVRMPPGIFFLELTYLILLMAFFVVFQTDHALRAALPAKIGPVPSSVVWFGAIGGVLAGLGGIYYHNANWDHGYDYWHYSRPFVGAVVGGIGALLYYVSLVLGAKNAVKPDPITFSVVAFLLAFADEAFRDLITKLTKLLFGAGKTNPTGATGSARNNKPPVP